MAWLGACKGSLGQSVEGTGQQSSQPGPLESGSQETRGHRGSSSAPRHTRRRATRTASGKNSSFRATAGGPAPVAPPAD